MTTSPDSGALPADKRDIYALAALLPEGVSWHDPITPDIAAHIAALASREAAEPTEAQKHRIIADFLERTGQYVTNDASREAAIKSAVEAARASPQVAPAPVPDPLQGAADWIKAGLIPCTASDIAGRLLIGYNRAFRLFSGAAPAPVAPTLSLDEILKAYSKAAPEFDAVVLQSFVDAYPFHGPALLRYAQVQLTSRRASREEVEQEEIDDDQMATSVESLHTKMTALRSAGAPVAPTPAQPSEDARDAARWRWLRDHSPFSISQLAGHTRFSSQFPLVIRGEMKAKHRLDLLADEAMSAPLPSEPEGEAS